MPRHVPVPVPLRSATSLKVAYLVWVRVRVTRIAERHNSTGQKVWKLEVMEEIEKAVDNGCKVRSGCLFRSLCCGNSSVLKLFLGGKGLSLLLCVHPRG